MRFSERKLADFGNGMQRRNKAHTATANRIAWRYETTYNDGNSHDIQTGAMVIEVETSASIAAGIEKLLRCQKPAYIAVTNMEAIEDALHQTAPTHLGVMDPRGNIVKESTLV